MSEADAAPSSSEAVMAEPVAESADVDSKRDASAGNFAEPDNKRRKISSSEKGVADKRYKLEERLGGILCCAVCLDLPRAAVYQRETPCERQGAFDALPIRVFQCLNGHLMCAGCFTHLLADARLRDETATCPNCRVEISKTSATRNLAVENAVSELPSECQYCNKQFPRNSLDRHEETQCEERIAVCRFSRIGCPWRGPLHESRQHEKECVHPNKNGAEVMEALQIMDQKLSDERIMYDSIFDLLTFEKITFNDLQLKPYRTDEFVHRLFYETSRFSAFNNQWVVKARINNSQKDPTQSSERDMTYQLIMKTKATTTLNIYYIVLKGPFGDMKINPRIYRHDFTEMENEGPYMPLSLPDTAECNRLLAAKTINFRLIMFLSSK